MRLSRFFSLVILLLLGPVAGLASVPDSPIRIQERTALIRGSIKLSDLVQESQRERLGKLGELVLGEAPAAGAELVFSNHSISQLIARRQNNFGSEREGKTKLRFDIPTKIVVEGAGWESSGRVAQEQVSEVLRSRCLTPCEVRLEEFKPPYFKTEFTPEVRYELSDLQAIKKGAFNIPVRVRLPSGQIQSAWIQGEARVFQEVAVAKRTLAAGWKVTKDDYLIRKEEITSEIDTPADPNLLGGQKLARAINPYQVLLSRHLSRENDVSFGDKVTAVFRSEALHVSFEGIAKKSGNLGDQITIYNPNTRKMLVGTLIEKGRVEIR